METIELKLPFVDGGKNSAEENKLRAKIHININIKATRDT